MNAYTLTLSMASFALVAELFEIMTAGLADQQEPPTDRSLARIKELLGVEIPDAYQLIASKCRNYGAYLAGIGEDHKKPGHIVRLNEIFHSSDPPLPSHLIMLNTGEHMECFCWDLSANRYSNEYPIVHVGLEESCGDARGRVRFDDIRHPNFHAYLEMIAVYYGSAVSSYPGCDAKVSARINELINMIQAAPQA